MKKRILVVDDQRLHREYMENVVRECADWELALSLTDAETGIEACRALPVDMVLMDIYTGGRFDGIEAAARIRESNTSIRIVLVTSMLDADYLGRARKAGADSLWYKDASPDTLADVIRRTFAGANVFPETTPKVQIGAITSDQLTATEIRVLRLLVEGYEYDEIAKELFVSPSTVKWHVSNILHKTGYANRTRLAVAVSQKKFIVPRIPDEE